MLGRGRFLAIKQYTYKSVNLPSCPVKVIFPSPPIRVASTNMISPPIAVHAKPSETNNHLFQLSSKWYFSLQYYPHIRTELLASLTSTGCLQGRGGGKESCAFRELRICTQPKTRELQISGQSRHYYVLRFKYSKQPIRAKVSIIPSLKPTVYMK